MIAAFLGLLSQQRGLESTKVGTVGFIAVEDEIYAHLIKSQTPAAVDVSRGELAWIPRARLKWELKSLTRTNEGEREREREREKEREREPEA